MKIVQINVSCGRGSTGKICLAVSKLLTQQGIENYILYAEGKSDYPLGIRYANHAYVKLEALRTRILGNYGFNSELATRRLIRHLERIQPDIVHLHNIHGHNCNLSMLFGYLKKKKIKLFWTFHDCWAFTGHCVHFTTVKCTQWKGHCVYCPLWNQHSWFFNRTNELFEKKKELFTGLDLTIITPSQWLAGLVKESFLKNYPVKVINNGIDLSVFKPTPSDYRERFEIKDKGMHLLLGVAYCWDERKGLDVFLELSRRLDKAKYKIALVGTNEKVDRTLSPEIISIHRTQDQRELAMLYSAADLFVNPTREDNYPTVNMEALACGTPVLTFRTGGSPEILDDTCGSVVDCDDVDALEREIVRICESSPYTEDACQKRAESFAEDKLFGEYVKLYR